MKPKENLKTARSHNKTQMAQSQYIAPRPHELKLHKAPMLQGFKVLACMS